MQCKHCGSPVNILDRSCGKCGKSLSLLDDGPQRSDNKPASVLESVIAGIDAEERLAEKALLADTHEYPTERGSDRGPSWRFKTLSRPEKLKFLDTGALGLETSPMEIQQIAGFTFHSPHVQANHLYRHRSGQTSMVYLHSVDVVNAFATDQRIEAIDAEPPLIALFGGLTRATRLASIGLGIDRAFRNGDSRELFVGLIQKLGTSIMKNGGKLFLQDIFDITDQLQLESRVSDGEVIRKANSYAFAMNMAVIAHELGHICLGHTLGARLNDEIARNQERQADLFAASVASASPFSDYIVAGGIFWWVILTWVAASSGERPETTHPHSRERLMDYIRANRDQAESLGIDEVTITQFLP